MILPIRPVRRVLALFALTVIYAAPAHSQCITTVVREDFDSGLPPSWSAWAWKSPPCSHGKPCAEGSYVAAVPSPCGHAGEQNGGSIVGPAIRLPMAAPGDILALDWCAYVHYDAAFVQVRPRLTISSPGGNLVFGMPIPQAIDLTPLQGLPVQFEWTWGPTDAEGDVSINIDGFSIEHRKGGWGDCNGNLMPDSCDVLFGTAHDCNANQVLDECELSTGTAFDCNANGSLDECDIANGTSHDFNSNGIPDECECSNTHFYCVGATNTTGKGAKIGYTGSTSITLNSLGLTAQDCPPNQVGIFFFGTFKTQSPFGEGFLCVSGNQKRLLPAVFLNASGAGSYQVNFANPNSPASTIQPLSEHNFQFWYRDPQLVGEGFNLSNALHLHFCP